MTRLDHVRKVYDREIEKIKHPDLWQNTLVNIAKYYKFTFTEAMLINAQVENATVMATLQVWNKYNRYINGGERSIAVFTSRTDTTLKYLFDISQTYGKPILKRWDLQDTHQEERFIERYNAKYGTNHTQVSSVLNNIYSNAMANIRDEVQETLRSYQSENPEIVEKLIADSTLCLMMSRCGYELPEDKLNFSAVSKINSDSLIIVVGNLSMKAAHEALLEIESAIRRKDYEIQRNGFGIRNEGRSVLSQDGNTQRQIGNEHQSEESDGYAEQSQSIGVRRSEYQRTERQNMGGDSRQSGEEGDRASQDTAQQPSHRLERQSTEGNGDSGGGGEAGQSADERTGEPVEQGGNDLTQPIRREELAAPVTEESTENEESSENDGSFSFADIQEGEAYVEILYSENSGLQENSIFSFEEANKIYAELDEQRCLERERGDWYGYDKTDFAIHTVINGEPYTYEGRYDIGDGEGTLLNHIEASLDWRLSYSDDLHIIEEELEELEFANDEFVPLLKNLVGELETTVFDREDSIETAIAGTLSPTTEEYVQATLSDDFIYDNNDRPSIKEELLRGSGFQGGKDRIERFYRDNHPDTSEFAAMLKKEYGIGGHSGSGEVKWFNHDGKGIAIEFTDGAKLTLTWREAAKRIAELIESGEYQGISVHNDEIDHETISIFGTEGAYQYYQQVKEAHPDEIVMNQVGDFYEMYGNDANAAAELLDIPITSRAVPNGERIEMCGIPSFALTDCIEKLHSKYDVAVISVSSDGRKTVLYPSTERATYSTAQEISSQTVIETKPVGNFHLEPGEKIEYASGEKAKYRDNITAIRTLKNIEKEKRTATLDEQNILSKYAGWGGLAKAFDKKAENWQKEYIELKALLTDKEYDAALNSTLTAYYTDPELIRPIYEMLERFGFKGGEILDPAMGTGNFFSVLPESISSQSHLHGVELDSITGRIAKLLYPKADIHVQGFEYSNFEDNTFDVAVGNVPFENFRISDIAYDREYVLYDYFFIKTLDKLKPGGIAVFITSSGTLDKYTTDARIDISEKAELIGAVRLPNNAFKAIAGTEVTTDILILKKREQPIRYNPYNQPSWVVSPQSLYDTNGKYAATVNRYFLENPEMVLGEQKAVSGRFGMDTQCLPKEGVELLPALSIALNSLNAQFTAEPTVYTEQDIEEEIEEKIEAPADSRNYCFYINESGDLYYRENEYIIPFKASSAKAENAIKAMCGLCDSMQRVIDVQLQVRGEAALQEAQERLTKDYDKFVKSYGYLNSSTNMRLFREDVRSALLLSLEEETDETVNTGVYVKADIFTKATITPNKRIVKVDNPLEALAASLNIKNSVDIQYMASLCGKSGEEVIAALEGKIYQNPVEYDGSPFSGWETAEEYLSGYVKDKLQIAEQFAEQYPELFERNVTALRDNQPPYISIADIDFSVGAVYIPADMYRDFMYETFETPRYLRANVARGNTIDVVYNSIFDQWKITNKSDNSINSTEIYGTSRVNAYEIMESSLNQKRVAVRDPVEYIKKNGDKGIKYVLNKNETQLARDRQTKIETLFKNWVLSESKRIQRIEEIYNDRFNALKVREYDGSYLQIPGLNSAVKYRPHQLNAIARIASGNNVMLAHEVGAGKTAVMAGAGMYMRSIGAVKKPLYVVPKPIVAQWGREFARFFPTAKVLVTDETDFEKKNRRRFLSKIATGDYDAVIMSQSQFEKIPLSLERQEAIFTEKKAQLMEAKEKARLEQSSKCFTPKQYAAAIKVIDKKLMKLRADFKKDDFLTFESLGCDYLFVDEAHAYKNLYVMTKHTNVAGINSNANSQRAFDMEMKTAYIQEINNGGGITMATGTPISNSIAECYVFQHFLQRQMLQKMGLDSFDSWASVYGNITVSLEVKPTGSGWRMRERFAEFKNLPELCNMMSQCFDVVKTADIEGINLPQIHGGKPEYIICEQSPAQVEQVAIGMERAARIEAGGVDVSVDNMLAVCSYMTKVSVDPRINDPQAEDWDTLKVNRCAEDIFQINEQYPGTTQVVFCDMSTPSSGTDFTVYQALKDKLVQSGKYKPEEVTFIHDAKNDRQRLTLFDKVNSAKVKVIIGSTSKLGTGVNMQRKLIAAHHLDAPYVPKDVEQRNGRIIRQGNENSEVFVKYYSTKGTFDSYRWQLLEKKQRLITQILSGKPPARNCKDIDESVLTFAEMKAASSDNPLIAEKMQLDNEVDRLKLLQRDWLHQQERYKYSIEVGLPSIIEKKSKLVEKINMDTEVLHKNPMQSDSFFLQVGETTYDTRSDAGKALISQWNKYMTSENYKEHEPSETVGKFRGFDIRFYSNAGMPLIYLVGESGIVYSRDFSLTEIGICIRLENLASDIPAQAEFTLKEIANAKKDIEKAKQQYGQPFEHAEELDELIQQQADINNRLELGEEKEIIYEEGEEEGEEMEM